MNLKNLKDNELLFQTKLLVQNERQVLTKILHHLREVERRKLFSDLGCQSLFEYAVKELKYSEGQAGRRIQAMRLIKEIPEIEKKIEKGSLSLSNISQAQSYFREVNKIEESLTTKNSEKRSGFKHKFETSEKLKILESLENKSAREGQRILIKMRPQVALPKERGRILTESHSEVRFVMSEDLKKRLEELRSLLGIKGSNMSLAELIDYMATVSIQDLKIKKFGKKRMLSQAISKAKSNEDSLSKKAQKAPLTPTPESQRDKNIRHISRAIKSQVWTRDQGKCTMCGSPRNLNIDHVKPIALGGNSNPENLRLLCFHCNQRQAMKVFGVNHVRQMQTKGNSQLSKLKSVN